MTAQNRTQLKALFETGDTLLESSFINLIDSFLDIAETSTQTIAGPIVFSSVVTFNNPVTANSTLTMGGTINLVNTNNNITGNIFLNGQYYSNSINSSVAATGTTRGSAAPITAALTFLTTVSAGTNDGIKVGTGTNTNWTRQDIINLTSATAKVYSFDNIQINSGIDGTTVVQLFPNQRMSVWSITIGGSTIQYTMVGAKASV